MGNKVLAILLLYWYWYGPYLYQKVLILVLVILFEPKSIQYFSAILFFYKNSNVTKFPIYCLCHLCSLASAAHAENLC